MTSFLRVFSASLLLLACEIERPEFDSNFIRQQNPDYISWDYDLLVTESGHPKYKLWTERVEVYKVQKLYTCHDSLRVRFFDPDTMAITHWLTANEGEWRQQNNDFIARKNVHVYNQEGHLLITDTLYYDYTEDRIYSRDPVRYTTQTDTLYGIGFESKSDLSQIRIFNVRGVSHRE